MHCLSVTSVSNHCSTLIRVIQDGWCCIHVAAHHGNRELCHHLVKKYKCDPQTTVSRDADRVEYDI